MNTSEVKELEAQRVIVRIGYLPDRFLTGTVPPGSSWTPNEVELLVLDNAYYSHDDPKDARRILVNWSKILWIEKANGKVAGL